jgi:hypothetical protein
VDTRTNPYGHYEDLDFLNLQREELARAIQGEDYLVTEDFSPSGAFLEKAKRLVEAKKKRYGDRPWGWKDPRTTLFLEPWKSLIPDLRILALLRPPRLVVNSLCARLRGYFSMKKKDLYLRTYTHYNRRIHDFMSAHPEEALVIPLARLITDPDEVLEKLGEALNFLCDPGTFRELYDAAAMSRPRRAWLFFNGKALREAEAVYGRLLSHGI